MKYPLVEQRQLLHPRVRHPGRLRLRGGGRSPQGVAGVGDVGHYAPLLGVARLLNRREE